MRNRGRNFDTPRRGETKGKYFTPPILSIRHFREDRDYQIPNNSFGLVRERTKGGPHSNERCTEKDRV